MLRISSNGYFLKPLFWAMGFSVVFLFAGCATPARNSTHSFPATIEYKKIWAELEVDNAANDIDVYMSISRKDSSRYRLVISSGSMTLSDVTFDLFLRDKKIYTVRRIMANPFSAISIDIQLQNPVSNPAYENGFDMGESDFYYNNISIRNFHGWIK